MDVLDYLDPNRDPDKKIVVDTQTEISGFYKTPKGFIINKDTDALTSYKLKKKKQIELNTMKDDITQLKNDMQEIKELLKGLVK